jgi:predicted HTH transcriptional regulator
MERRIQDASNGDLFTQVATTIDALQTKYLKAAIRYEGILEAANPFGGDESITEGGGVASGKTSEKTPEKILSLLPRWPGSSLNEVATEIGKTSRTVERAVAKLAESGRLKRIGPDKGGHWEVIP